MCILMVIHRSVQDYPIVLAANRDEYLDRVADAPRRLGQSPLVWGGQDRRAGGTWLGLNACGLLVGLTNRRTKDQAPNDPARRSRGLLCLDVLQCRSAAEAVAWFRCEPPHRYNPFNLFIVDPLEAYWAVYDEVVQTQRLAAGMYILANGDLNDINTVRIRRARRLLEQSDCTELDILLPVLERVCRDHEVGVQDRDTICMHRPQEKYGTVSSTILAVGADWRRSLYRYAGGAPCTTPYKDYSALFVER